MLESILYYIVITMLNGICTITTFFFLLSFFKIREKFENKKIIMCLIFYFVSIMIQIPNSFMSYKSFVWVTPVYFTFQIIFVTYVFKGNFIYKMMLFLADKIADSLYAILFYLMMFYLEDLGLNINTSVATYEGLNNFKLIIYVINAVALVPFKYMIVKIFQWIIDNFEKIKNISFLMIPASQLIIFSAFFITIKSGSETDPVGTIWFASIGAVVGTVGFMLMFFNYRDIRKKTILEQQLYFANKTQEELFSSIDIYAESQKRQSMINHDYKNQLNTVLMLLKDKEYTATENFVSDLLDTVKEGDSNIYCANPIVNATINYKAYKAKELNIRLNTDIIIPEEIDEISEMNLCSIFSNPIDNAIEANEKLPESDRYINIKARCDKLMLVIKIENPVAVPPKTAKGILPRTSKEDTKNHGFGLMIIKEIAEKTGGKVEVKADSNKVEVEIRVLLGGIKEMEK